MFAKCLLIRRYPNLEPPPVLRAPHCTILVYLPAYRFRHSCLPASQLSDLQL